MSKDTKYEQKALTASIRATSRASVKIKESFYTVEYSEERVLPTGLIDVDIEAEKQLLWDDVNREVDNQIEDILKSF